MKINRLIAMFGIALLVVLTMGFTTTRGQAQVAAAAVQEQKVTQAPDTDNIEEQVGDQNETDLSEPGSDVESDVTDPASEITQAPDTDTIEEQVGDQNGTDLSGPGSDVGNSTTTQDNSQQDNQDTGSGSSDSASSNQGNH